MDFSHWEMIYAGISLLLIKVLVAVYRSSCGCDADSGAGQGVYGGRPGRGPHSSGYSLRKGKRY